MEVFVFDFFEVFNVEEVEGDFIFGIGFGEKVFKVILVGECYFVFV